MNGEKIFITNIVLLLSRMAATRFTSVHQMYRCMQIITGKTLLSCKKDSKDSVLQKIVLKLTVHTAVNGLPTSTACGKAVITPLKIKQIWVSNIFYLNYITIFQNMSLYCVKLCETISNFYPSQKNTKPTT